MNDTDQDLIDRYFLDQASPDEIAILEARLLADPELRQRYLHGAMDEADLRNFALRGDADPIPMAVTAEQPKRNRAGVMVMVGAIAAAIAVVCFIVFGGSDPTAGSIVSSEGAGWQSDQPTISGARFGPGEYLLQSGGATLRFDSGAEMEVEGPASFSVVSAMHVVFEHGAPSFFVPESAVGFRVDTPYGGVIDHGTEFSLRIPEDPSQRMVAAVHEGEIAIHHREGDVRHLVTDEAAEVDEKEIRVGLEGVTEEYFVPESREHLVMRLGTEGQETSIVVDDNREGRLDPDVLMVKKQKNGHESNRRALLGFDVSQVPLERVDKVTLLLHAVPTYRGKARGMPLKSEMVLYGIPDGEREDWPSDGLRWADAPKPDDAIPLVTFYRTRASQRGLYELSSPELLEFLKSDQSGEVSFLIDCKTRGSGRQLVWGFAASLHREAPGPMLELELKKDEEQ